MGDRPIEPEVVDALHREPEFWHMQSYLAIDATVRELRTSLQIAVSALEKIGREFDPEDMDFDPVPAIVARALIAISSAHTVTGSPDEEAAA